MARGKSKKRPVLVVGDLHAPFELPGYFKECKRQYKDFGCRDVVFIGDIMDVHACSFFDHDPSGYSPGEELEHAREQVRKWYLQWPTARVCIGNHDARFHRRATRFGLPDAVIRSLPEIYNTPGWDFKFVHEVSDVLCLHGDPCSGVNAARRKAEKNRQSVAIGHTHRHGGVHYLACDKDLIFAMNVGCGLDDDAYSMAYARNVSEKSTIGCGIIISDREAYFVPMDLGSKR